jgi:glycosyltransferase involved in cell wall biosynthesis
MASPLATIAFVPREQFGTTRRSLEALYARTQTPFELVCVDGGSPPEVREYLTNAASKFGFTLLRTETFLSPNQARNLAIPFVRSKYVIFMDNDVMVSPGWLEPLLNCAEETGAWVAAPLYFEFEPEGAKIHMFGGKCRLETLPSGGRAYIERHDLPHVRLCDLREPLTRRETELVEFHTTLVATAALRKLGPLDEGLLNHAEHGDLCLQVRQAGKKIFLEPRSRITCVPPRRLSGVDLEYFRLRWSEAWTVATCDRLQDKYQLSPLDPYGLQTLRWVTGYRQYALAWLSGLRRVCGRKVARWLERRIIARLETAANRRQFPIGTTGAIERPVVQVVYSPDARITLAA